MLIYVSKVSVVRCLSNAIIKVPRNLLRKNFEHSCYQILLEWHFRKRIYHNSNGSRSHLLVISKKMKTKTRNTMAFFISFKSHLYSKQGSPIFLLCGSWSVVFFFMLGLSQSFSFNSNLIILVDI